MCAKDVWKMIITVILVENSFVILVSKNMKPMGGIVLKYTIKQNPSMPLISKTLLLNTEGQLR